MSGQGSVDYHLIRYNDSGAEVSKYHGSDALMDLLDEADQGK